MKIRQTNPIPYTVDLYLTDRHLLGGDVLVSELNVSVKTGIPPLVILFIWPN